MAAKISESPKNTISLPADMKVFAIPGLGVDGRIYRQLAHYFTDFKVIEWLIPFAQESLQSYAHRMAQALKSYRGRKILIGTSFGGVVAQEIVQFEEVDALILLSTFKKGDARPWFFPLAERIPAYKLFKGKWRYRMLPYWAPIFGISDPEEQRLLQSMFMDAPTEHRIWGAEKITAWKGRPLNLPFVHIHGKEDKLFSASDISNARFLPHTGHFMVVQKADEVAEEIQKFLTKVFEPARPSA